MQCYTKNTCRFAHNDDRIYSLYELGKCLATALGINIPGADVVPSQEFGHFCPLLFVYYCFVPHQNHQYGKCPLKYYIGFF